MLRHRSAAFSKHVCVQWIPDHETVSCSVHTDQTCSLYCKQDALPICVLCSYSTHKNHDLSLLSEETKSCADRMRGALATLDSLTVEARASASAFLSAYEGHVGRSLSDTEKPTAEERPTASAKAAMQLRFRCDELRGAINEWESRLLEQVPQAAENVERELLANYNTKSLLVTLAHSLHSTLSNSIRDQSALKLLQREAAIIDHIERLDYSVHNLPLRVNEKHKIDFDIHGLNNIFKELKRLSNLSESCLDNFDLVVMPPGVYVRSIEN